MRARPRRTVLARRPFTVTLTRRRRSPRGARRRIVNARRLLHDRDAGSVAPAAVTDDDVGAVPESAPGASARYEYGPLTPSSARSAGQPDRTSSHSARPPPLSPTSNRER